MPVSGACVINAAEDPMAIWVDAALIRLVAVEPKIETNKSRENIWPLLLYTQ